MRRFATLSSIGLVGLLLLSAGVAHADFADDLQGTFEGALNSGSWGLALGVVFVFGVLTSLTPCVYPMIVITVSIFGAREAKSKLHGAGLSTMYVLGIAALFTPLGLLAALTGDVFGSLLANPWVLGGLAIFFVALAASMFGAFELSLPPALQNRLAQMGGLGPKGAFVLGLVGGLIAAPCTGPALSFLLAWVGTTGNALFGGLALFVYALGLGLLTWLVGTFAIGLPKSGRWLDWVKSVFGIVMIVAALYFIRDLIPGLTSLVERTPLALGVAIALVVLGLGLGAVHLTFHGANPTTATRKGLGIALTSAGLMGAVLWLSAMPPLPPGAGFEWLEDYESALARAEREGRPLMVDFGASWCGACEELERHTFSDPRVVSEGRRFVTVRIDLSPGEDLARGRAILARYEQRGLPLVVLHGSDGAEVERITSFIEPERMLQIMQAVR